MQYIVLIQTVGGRPSDDRVNLAETGSQLGAQRSDRAGQGGRDDDFLPREVHPLQLLAHGVAHRGLLLRPPAAGSASSC